MIITLSILVLCAKTIILSCSMLSFIMTNCILKNNIYIINDKDEVINDEDEVFIPLKHREDLVYAY